MPESPTTTFLSHWPADLRERREPLLDLDDEEVLVVLRVLVEAVNEVGDPLSLTWLRGVVTADMFTGSVAIARLNTNR